MKRIEFVAPVESMRGNLSGSQKLKYAEHDNRAFEAPNGAQSAKNYQPRFIGAKRAKDGLKYFAVRTKQTSVLNAKTRTAMAITGSIAAIKSALMKSHATDWAKIQQSYEYVMQQGLLPENVTTFNKYVDYYLRDMLRYKKTAWSFTQASISFSVANPFKLDNEAALNIKQSIWDKFAPMLAFSSSDIGSFEIDGKLIVMADRTATWGGGKSTTKSQNSTAQWADISIADTKVLYKSLSVYSSNGVEQDEDARPNGGVYTTIVPEA